MRLRTLTRSPAGRRRGTEPRPAPAADPAPSPAADPEPSPAADPAPTAAGVLEPGDPRFDEHRARLEGGPDDRAQYGCSCGFVWQADVSASVACPYCGAAQAW